MIKMILSDMDGTLLDNDGCLPEDFDEVMELLKERGVIFVPASGRQYSAMIRYLSKYENEIPFISENGSVAFYKGKEIFSSQMKKENIKNLIKKIAFREDIYCAFCGQKMTYISKKWEPYMYFINEFLTKYEMYDDVEEVLAQKDIIKVAFCDCEHGRAGENIYPIISEAANGDFDVKLSSNYWVDVMEKGLNKAVPMKCLQEYFSILPSECAAFGDYLNDLEMLAGVEYSYAMANAHPEVIIAAKYVAPANNKNGVMRTIKSFLEKGLI